MQQDILTTTEVAKRISDGQTLLLAGEEKLLGQLPKGKWIAGTIPYSRIFMVGQEPLISCLCFWASLAIFKWCYLPGLRVSYFQKS